MCLFTTEASLFWLTFFCQNYVFCVKFEGCFKENAMVLTIRGLTYSHSRPSIHHYTSNDGYETFKQQWMSLHTAHHPISLADMGLKICYFASTMRVIFKEMALFSTIRSSCMPPEALLTILIHVRIGVKYSSSNGCLSLRKSSMFSMLTFCQTFVILLEI